MHNNRSRDWSQIFLQQGMRFAILIGVFATLFFYTQCSKGFSQGRQLYLNHCANCHGADGQGLRSLYPPIAQSDYLENNYEELACIIRFGIDKTLTVNGKSYSTPMVGLDELSEIEICNIVNFISTEWHPKNSYISLKDINMIIGKCK